MFWLHCAACRVSQFANQRLNVCPKRWKRRVQPLDPGAPGSSAPTPSGRPHCPAHPGRIPNPHRPPRLPPRLREQDVAGETLPAAVARGGSQGVNFLLQGDPLNPLGRAVPPRLRCIVPPGQSPWSTTVGSAATSEHWTLSFLHCLCPLMLPAEQPAHSVQL